MNINYKEAQFEFFPESARTPDETKRPHFMAARFNLSIENLVIFSVVSIMVVIFSFSLGVERGKSVALRQSGEFKTDVASSAVLPKPAPVAEPDGVAAGMVPLKTDSIRTDVKRTGGNESRKIAKNAGTPVKTATPLVATAKDASPKAGAYTVQVASYKSEKHAQKEAQSLKGKGYQVFVLSKGQHVALCVGSFHKKEEASFFGKKLKGRYQDFVVRRL